MKHLLLISALAFVLTSCKKESTYDYMIFNETTNGVVKMKAQTIDLQGGAALDMQLQSKMGVSIYTAKDGSSLHNKENGTEISVIKNIAILLNDSSTLQHLNPKASINWKYTEVSSSHGIYSLTLTDKSFNKTNQ